ncbi:tyrosine-protein kinase receptor Tie-1-like isoform X1 [Apostichopus japonicus]|uniref:tyrosine-protein kinase receptor Tie-1-like isoform X1 n=1 Tax=Stichopus japonicus TaxID=307972 RepID=UPI003AB2320A
MHYLASQKFCHPALSLRKVLMTPQGSCKLYDIYPNNLCMERIKHLMKKKNPPTAWMATEILPLEKYFLKSDSWNFSVFLWELLSIGKIQFAGISQEDIKAKILDGFMLSRPYVCPKDMYQDYLLLAFTSQRSSGFELWCLAGKRTTPCDLRAVIYCNLYGVNMKICMKNIKTVITQKSRSDSMSIVESVNGVYISTSLDFLV